ncbi:unnamed protein product [Closterium sp. Yama58-4]|nr:unnamed protein product [Closterium sp. Yama58-4]
MRRDRLNDRFLELGRELDPDLPPKTDKAVILNDTVKLLTRLKEEAIALTEGNRQLRDQIKELKVEKSELREEKLRLKAEKDVLQGKLHSLPVPATGCFTSQAAAAAASAALQAAAVAAFSGQITAKPADYSHVFAVAPPPVDAADQNTGMWQWLPPNAADISRDHILRPPVA